MADPKEKAANLLVAAEKYDLMELKQMCEESLCVNMSLRNVLDTMMAKSTPRNCLTSARYSVTSSDGVIYWRHEPERRGHPESADPHGLGG